MNATLSINPKYADMILSGNKTFELRRAIFQKDVDKVFIYATAPISKVVGEFKIAELLECNAGLLWLQVAGSAGVSKEKFYQYFEGKKRGYAIKVKGVKEYVVPFSLIADFNIPTAPQNFCYTERVHDGVKIKSTQGMLF